MIPLFPPLLALIAGILASRYLDPGAVWLCLPLAVLLAFARKPCAFLAIFLLGAGLRSREPAVPAIPSGSEASRVIGTLMRRPEWRGLGVYLDLSIESVDGRPAHGRTRLTEFLDDPELLAMFDAHDLATGDRLEVLVRLRRPTTYRNRGVFDFRRHLERQGIYWTGTIRNPRLITVIERGPSLRRRTDRLQRALEERLERRFENPDVRGLVLGMVLGRKHNLTADVERDFQAGGLYHMVVVSGFNLAVVAGAAAAAARFALRRRGARMALVAASVLGYSALVGGDPPVVRATLMVGILLAARLLDRDYSPLNAAAMAAFALLTFNPVSLEDPSFQMTFAAVAAVTGVGMPAARWAMRDLHEKLRDFRNADRDGFLSAEAADWRVARRLRCELYRLPYATVTLPWRLWQVVVEAGIVSLAVELVFVAFMVESFHRLSLVSPFLNVPAGIVASVVTPLGLLLLGAPDPAALPAAWIVRRLLEALLGLLHGALALPNASLRVPSAPLWIWVLYGLAVGVMIASIHMRRRRPACGGLAGAIALQAAMVLTDFSTPPPEAVTVTFLDVGQGDSTLVEFPDGRRMLIDGGGVAAGRFLGLQDESTFSIGENVLSAYLFSRRIRRLDAVVLTHAHNDHMDGLFEVLENFRVGELWLGRNPMIPAYRALIESAEEKGVPLRWVSAGMQIGEFTVLHPPRRWRTRRTADNNDSVVLLMNAGKQTALFTGDLEMPLPGVAFVDLLKVPHHGSRNARMRVRSRVRVISVGASNPFGHPHPSVPPALRTDVLGAIEVRMEGDRPVVRVE